ncbi:MAG: hypothetical protein AMXMBFR33_39800 [Candidatus Xenobia bacterium]
MSDDNRIGNGRGSERSERSERSRGSRSARENGRAERTTGSTVPNMRSLFFHDADRMMVLQDARTSNQEIFQGWSRAAGDENRGPGRSEDAPGQNRGAGRSDDDRGENRGPGRSDDRGENRGPGRSEDAPGQNRGPGRSDDDRGENRGPSRSDDRGPGRSEEAPGQNRAPNRPDSDDRGSRRSEDDRGENRGPNRSDDDRGARRTDESRQTRRTEESERREPPGQAKKNDESRREENRLRTDGPGHSEDAPGQARKREGPEERSSLMERIREAMRKEETRRQEPAEPARRDPPQNQQSEPRRPAQAQPEPPRKAPLPAQPEPPRKQPAAETMRRPPDEPVRKIPVVVSAPVHQPVRKPETQAGAAVPEQPTPTPPQPASRALYKRLDAPPRLPEQSTAPTARVNSPQVPQESRLPTPQARLPELPRAPRGEQPMTPAPTPAVRADRPAPQRVDPAPSHATVVSRSSAEGAGTQSGGQQESEGRARPTEIARLSAPVVRENRLLSRFLLPGRAELEEELEALKNSPRVESISKRNRGGQGGGGGQQSSGQSAGQASGGPAAEVGLEVVDPHTGLPRMLIRPGLQPILPQLEQLFSTAGLAYAADTEDTPEFMRSYWIAMAWLSQHQEQHGLNERMCYFGAAMFEGMQGWRRKGQVSEEQVVNRLLAMLAEEGGFLGEHSLRVMTFADAVCEDLNVQDPAIREQVRSGALLRDLGMAGLDYRQLPPMLSEQFNGLRSSGDLHMAGRLADIGALRVPAEIRNKPGPLNAEERALMEKHPEFGEQFLARFPPFRHLGPIVRAHHERWDGRGYPDGLMGRRIPMAARIIAVSDVFDALTSERPWREAWSYERAVSAIQEGAGTQFDPEVVRAFLRTSRRLKAGGYLD